MDPVLQRLGDVTIQRLEKPREPKMGPQNVPVAKPKENKDEMNSSPEDDSGDDFSIPGLKRSMISNEISMKKFKFGPSGLPIGKKTDDLSETEMSDYDSESEMEDSEDESHELNTNAPLNQKVTPNKNFPVPQLPIQAPSNSDEDEGSSGASFFEKLVQQTTVTEPPPPSTPDSNTPKEPNIPIKQEAASEEDYDIDIKEKLKEMGEISFETVKKGEKPKKTEVVENEVVVTTKKLGADGEEIPGLPKGIALRRNIREVMDETKLDESTLAAQRQEVERLRRVQEQQRLLRELQKQAAQERMQNRVISLLQGGHYSKPGTSQQTRIGNTVLVKLPNGQTKPMTRIPKRPFELLRYQKKVAQQPMSATKVSKNLLPPKKIPTGPDLTPSVSIAPVSKKMMPPIMQRHSDSDSESDERKIMSPPLTHKPKGKPPVQTIDISSDDDCIVVSEPEEEEEETEDDPTNSGMHTNDQFNQPDEQGRVLVNVGHPEGEPDVFVAPQISRIIKPHQIGGVRFLYDNVVESTSRFESSTGFGCILAHSMGLGKTLQIVTFSDIFLRHTSAKTILCIMPINTLQNWMAEYNMWIPPEESVASSPLAAHGEVRPRNFNILVLNDSHKTLVARAKVIHEWRTNGGVLLIGYEQFRLLSQRKMPKSRRKVNPEIDDNRNSKLFDEVHTALIKPGPDLVICDEGHRIKNSHASISQALKQMETKRRVVLTGYPLQNNLMEYWCMVDFVRPNYLGSKTEFCNMFERPIMNGQCIDSTEADIKLMRYRAHVLHSLLIGFVQRRSHAVLQTALPQKEEYVLLVRMTPFQRTLYETFMNEVVRVQAVPNPLKAFAVCCKIWNHPDVLYNFLKKRAGGEAVDIDLEEVGGAPITKTANEKPPPKSKRKTPAKGKNGKPAASVTPYNSSTEGTGTPLVQSVSTAPTTTFSSTSPITSFANALSQQSKIKTQQCTSSQDSTTIQDISNNFPDTILQPYYDQEFDQNAQFPSTFPNSNNYNYPNTSNANTDYNSSFNLSEHTQKTSFLNLDSQNSTLTPLSSKVSLTPLTSKTKDLSLSGNSTLTSLNNMNNSLNTTSALTPLKNACNMLNSVGSVPDGVNNNMQPSSEDIMEIGCSGNGNNPVFGQDRQRNYNIENNTNFQNEYNYQQNYWNQPQQQENTTSYDNQHSDYFGPPNNQFNPHLTNSTSSWMKKEDLKPNVSNMINLKNEISNENKPKINIISDIKLPPVFSTATTTTSMDKKINIISDIKIEPKIEEGVDIYDVKPNVLPPLPSLTPFKTEFKNEFQSDIKTEFKNEIKNEDEHKDEKPQLPTPVQENPFSKLNPLALKDSKEDSGIPYDWAIELLQDYKPGCIENSAKMGILFCIIRESIALGDRLLVFSQSLITLDLIEQFLQMSQVPGETFNWAKNSSYYRLDGSTSALEREKLINEFNSNPKIHVFLVSTRAGSLGINLIGANRVVVLDASWNPCHDTQAVCRVYRYGQRKPCFVYRLVVDNCLEKKIYDRQINKQGMSDRVVDECNPDAHLTMKDVSTLCWDDKTDDVEEKDWAHVKDNYIDVVLQKVLEKYGRTLNKEPFQHESLLVDRKEKQLSQQEKRLAKKGYEREKQASRQPAYSLMGSARGHRPVASVRPMQQGERPSRWIPAEHWQRQGMTAQEMTLPLDVVIPTNQPEKGNIVLKAGQKVLVLKSPKGVYMQLESGKIVAIKTAIKVKGKADEGGDPTKMVKPPLLPPSIKGNPSLSVVPQKRVVKPFVPGTAKFGVQSVRQSVPNLVSRIKNMQKNIQPGKKMSQNVGCEVPKSFVGGKDDRMPIGSSDDEHKDTPSLLQHLERMKRTPQPPHQESNDDIEKRIALLKKNISIQRVAAKTTAPPTPQQAPAPLPLAPPARPAIVDEDDEKEESSPEHSGVEQMDHSNSSMLGDSTPFQDTLDSITSAYQATNDENLESYEDDEISEQSDPKHQEQSEISDHSDDVTYVSDQSPTSQYNSQAPNHQQSSSTTTDQPKTENQDYGSYNNYYNYQAPPYHAPPHPQGYGYPQPPPQPYDMMYPPQPQQPQYNYGYQGYPPPPQPHYPPHPPPPQPGYDYSGQAPPPAQPMYGGYNPYPTQYPPPPPTQGMYPPPPATGPTPQYSEYQQYAPPMNNVAPPPSQYYPNS